MPNSRVCLVLALLSLFAGTASAQPIVVTEDNYVEAEVDLSFAPTVKEVGSNKFRHDRSLMPLDKQPAVTMNRDTIYSLGAYYAPKGTKIELPKSKDDRYQSAMILQTDHYIDQVFYGPKGGNTDNFPNYLETPGDNWYLDMRIYRAEAAVIDGTYELPVPKPVKTIKSDSNNKEAQ